MGMGINAGLRYLAAVHAWGVEGAGWSAGAFIGLGNKGFGSAVHVSTGLYNLVPDSATPVPLITSSACDVFPDSAPLSSGDDTCNASQVDDGAGTTVVQVHTYRAGVLSDLVSFMVVGHNVD